MAVIDSKKNLDSNHKISHYNTFNVYLMIGGLTDLTGKDCNKELLLHQSFQGLLDISTRLILITIQKITKHHHLTMSVVGMSIGRKSVSYGKLALFFK